MSRTINVIVRDGGMVRQTVHIDLLSDNSHLHGKALQSLLMRAGPRGSQEAVIGDTKFVVCIYNEAALGPEAHVEIDKKDEAIR